jgi:hypothetical protein
MNNGKRFVFTFSLLLSPQAYAEEKEPDLTFEIGGAGGWPLSHGGASYGSEVALEYTVIEHWLEIELGTSPQFSKGQAEIGTDFLLKMPFELTTRLEMLISAGPVWIHKPDANSVAAEVTTEFVYAAWPKEHVGIFFEPSYTYDFGKGHEQSIGFTAGLHIGIE